MEEIINILREIIVPGATALTGYGVHYLKSKNDRKREEAQILIEEQKVKNELREIIVTLESEINKMYIKHGEEIRKLHRTVRDLQAEAKNLRGGNSNGNG